MSCRRLDRSILQTALWLALISLFSWLIFHHRQSQFLKVCHLHSFSRLSFCISTDAPLPSVKFNVTETLISANDGLTRVLDHIAVMHAFPKLLPGLEWTMTNLSIDMRTASFYPGTRHKLLLQYRTYRFASSLAHTAIVRLFKGIFEDVVLVLLLTHNIIDQLQQLHKSTSDPKKTFFTSFIRGLFRRPTRSVIGEFSLKAENYLAKLLPTVKTNINTNEGLIKNFREALGSLDNIQAIVNDDRSQWEAEHVPTISSRIAKLRQWISSMITSTELPEDEPRPDEKLAQLRPLIVQGSQSVEYILSEYQIIHADLERFAREMKQLERWAHELSPQAAVHDLRPGLKRLTKSAEEYEDIIWDDILVFRLIPFADRELNPLTKRIEAVAESRKNLTQEATEETGKDKRTGQAKRPWWRVLFSFFLR